MKCQLCSSLFEPTPEEEIILRNSEASYIPFCCETCYRRYHGISGRRSVPPRNALFWHIGEKTAVKIGGTSCDIVVRPMTKDDVLLVQRWRGVGFSDPDDEDVSSFLPSEIFYGKDVVIAN